MNEFLDLPLKDRIKRYLDLAGDARAEAACAISPARETYLRIAERWERIAAALGESGPPRTGNP